MGIKELKETLDLLAALIKMIDASLVDKKIDMADFGLLMMLVPVIGPAVEGIDKVDDELKDLDEAEMADLKKYLDEKFGTGAYEQIGKEFLSCALSVVKVLKLIQGMKAA